MGSHENLFDEKGLYYASDVNRSGEESLWKPKYKIQY